MGILKKISVLLLISLIIMSMFIVWVYFPDFYNVLGEIFYKVFNDWIIWMYIIILSITFGGGGIYGPGYGYIKRSRVKGTLLSLFGAIILLSGLITLIFYTILTIIFTSLLIIEIKFILFIIIGIAASPILLLILEKWFDTTTFFKDIWSQRKDYYKLTYSVEEKGKLTYIHIHSNSTNIQQIYEPAATLKIQEAFHKIKKNPNVSLALFIKSGLLHFVTEVVRNFTSWPRAKNRIYRRIAKVKIGKNVCISHWTRLDPLFPDLIEFEDGSGVGIGCQLLTHNFMNEDPLTICIGPIRIKKNARVGAFSTILPGVTIGEGAIVGAGSVIADDIPSYSIAYGVPAKVIRKIEIQNDKNEP